MSRRYGVEGGRQSNARGVDVGWGAGEDPRSGLLDRQGVVAGDLELDLHGELLALFDGVKLRELLVDRGEVPAELGQLVVGHEQMRRGNLVGERNNGVFAVGVQQDFLWLGVGLRVGDEVLAELRVDVVGAFGAVGGIDADGHAVDWFV